MAHSLARLGIFALTTFAIVEASAGAGPAAKSGGSAGAAVYEKACASCHGPDLKGGLPGIAAPNLTDAAWRFGGRDEKTYKMHPSDIETTVLYGIRSGHPKAREAAVMPAWSAPGRPPALLKPADLEDTLAFVRHLAGQTVDVEQARRGRTLFESKAACFDCHAGDAQGDSSIGAPDLTHPATWLYGSSADDIRKSVVEGRSSSMPAFEGVLTKSEVKAVSAYVYGKAAGYDF